MLRHYSAHVAWSDEDEAYVATSPEFPGLSGVDEDPDAALAELREAMEMALETYDDEGWPPPKPEKRQDFSGQFRLRVPKTLHAALVERAQLDEVSLNTLAVTYIARALGRDASLTRAERDYGALLRTLQQTFLDSLQFRQAQAENLTSLPTGEYPTGRASATVSLC